LVTTTGILSGGNQRNELLGRIKADLRGFKNFGGLVLCVVAIGKNHPPMAKRGIE
jgi:hypothetical protein